VDYFNTYNLKGALKKRAIRGGGVTVLSQAGRFCVQTITVIILARLLGPEEFGLVAMVMALGGFLTIFIDIGLTDAIIQNPEISQEQVSTLFWINIGITVIVVLIVVAFSPLLAWFYSERRLVNITILWSTYLIFGALSTQSIALLKRRMLFAQNSANEITAAVVSGLVAIYCAATGCSYWALVFREISFAFCRSLGAWILCRWRPGLPSLTGNIRGLLLFGRNATGSFIVGYFARNLDKVLVGWRYGADQLGYYHRAYYLFVLPTTQLTEALKNVATSTLSKLRSEPRRYISYYIKGLYVISFVGMPISFFFMVASEDLILVLFGPQWEESVGIFRTLAAGTGVWLVYSTKYWLHASLGRSDRLIKWAFVDFLVIAAGVVIGLRFGPQGVALAYTCALYLLTGFGLKYAGEPIGLKLVSVVSAVWKYFGAALLAALVCWWLFGVWGSEMSRLGRLSLCFIVYSSSYIIFVLSLHRSFSPIKDMVAVIKEIFPKSNNATLDL